MLIECCKLRGLCRSILCTSPQNLPNIAEDCRGTAIAGNVSPSPSVRNSLTVVTSLLTASLLLCTVQSVAIAHPSALQRAHAQSPLVEVPLTQAGSFSTPDESLAPGLEVLDRQFVDVDGDGDIDQLAFVDLADRPMLAARRAQLGRGAVVFINDAGQWRGQTVASVGSRSVEAAYNWAAAPSLVRRGAPVLRVLYSGAHAGRFAQAEYQVRFDRNMLRAVRTHAAISKR
jgi:hypothetical protein